MELRGLKAPFYTRAVCAVCVLIYSFINHIHIFYQMCIMMHTYFASTGNCLQGIVTLQCPPSKVLHCERTV